MFLKTFLKLKRGASVGVAEINFYKGERKEVSATIRPYQSNEVVVIQSATYEVTKMFAKEDVLFNWDCEINDDEITILLEFLDVGQYELEVTAIVGREKLIEKAKINVI